MLWYTGSVSHQYISSPFPTAPLQTGRATFISIRLSSFQWPSSSLVTHHRRITRHLLVYPLYYLFPFATYQAFSGSDYYGNSVALRVSPGRRSRIPVKLNVKRA